MNLSQILMIEKQLSLLIRYQSRNMLTDFKIQIVLPNFQLFLNKNTIFALISIKFQFKIYIVYFIIISSMENTLNKLQIQQSERSDNHQQLNILSTPSRIDHQLKNRYLEKMGDPKKIRQRAERLLSCCENIVITQHYFHQIFIQPIDATLDQISLMLSYGNYSIQVSVLMTQLDQQLFFNEEISSGSFASVYEVRVKKRIYAIKGINATVDVFNSFKHIYQEYFICYIASALGVGPKVEPLFGYDIVFFKNKVFFAMEKCSPIIFYSQSLAEQLRQNLRILHSIRLVHLDLKPNNITFSQASSKPVFLDFGFSRFIEEEVGYKTKTHFYGTKKYCSPEMKRLYYLDKWQMVDLYYNDVYCLQKSQIQMRGQKQKQEELKQNEQDKSYEMQKLCICENQISYTSLIITLNFRFALSNDNIQKAIQIWKQSPSLERVFYVLLKGQNNFGTKLSKQQLADFIKKKKINLQPPYSAFEKTFIEKAFSNSFGSLSPLTWSVTFIAQLEIDKFRTIMDDIDQVYRVFTIFNPLSNLVNRNSSPQKLEFVDNLRKRIVEKIIEMTPNMEQAILYKKIRHVICYFYQKLKSIKKRQLQYSFKMIFLLICDWSQFSEIDSDLYGCTEEIELKILTIIQLAVLSRVRRDQQNYEKYKRWLRETQNCDNQVTVLKQLGIQVLICESQNLYQTSKMLITHLEELTNGRKLQKQHLQIISNIKWIFFRAVEKDLYHQWLKKNCQTLVQKIYHCRIFQGTLLYQDKHFTDIRELFSPIRLCNQDFLNKRSVNQVYTQLFSEAFSTKQTLRFTLVASHCSVFVARQHLFPLFLKQYFAAFEKVEKHPIGMIRFFEFFQYVFQLQLSSQIKSQMNEFQLKYLQTALTLFKHHFGFFSYHLWYQIISATLEGMNVSFDKNKEQLTKSINLILRLLFACLEDQSQNLQIMKKIVFFFFAFEKSFIQFQNNQLRACLIQFVEQIVARSIYKLLDSDIKIFPLAVHIFNMEGKYQQSTNLIVWYIDRCKIHPNFSRFDHKNYSSPLVYAIKSFLSTLPKKEGIQILQKLRARDSQNMEGEYAYFEFQILLFIFEFLPKELVQKQITRIAFTIKKMNHVIVRQVKMGLSKIWVKAKLYHTKRKRKSILMNGRLFGIMIKMIDIWIPKCQIETIKKLLELKVKRLIQN